MRQRIRHLLNRCGYDIHRIGAGQNLADFIHARDINLVFDVGANIGQFGQSLRRNGYRGRIVSFEPVAAAYKILNLAAAADRNWETNNFALGERTETTTINVATGSVFSSILPFTDAAARHDCHAAATGNEMIEVRELDDVCQPGTANALLKIDTQGYERQVLEGGRTTLSMMKGILMELPIVHLYEGTWQFHQAIEYMAEAGFVPAQIHPVSYHSKDTVSLVEVDCLFRPRDHRLD